MKKTFFYYSITLIICFNALQISLCQAQSEMQIPIPNGKARIIFTRTWQLLGATVPQYLIDKGTGVTFNAVVLQKKIHPDSIGNSSAYTNIRLLIIKDTSSVLIKNHKTIDLES